MGSSAMASGDREGRLRALLLLLSLCHGARSHISENGYEEEMSRTGNNRDPNRERNEKGGVGRTGERGRCKRENLELRSLPKDSLYPT